MSRRCCPAPIDRPPLMIPCFRTPHPMVPRVATARDLGHKLRHGHTDHLQMRMGLARTYLREDRLDPTQDNLEAHSIVSLHSMVRLTEGTLDFPLHLRDLQFRPRHRIRDQTGQTCLSSTFPTTLRTLTCTNSFAHMGIF